LKKNVFDSSGHRDELSVIADILRVAMYEPLKTRIMYKANLSHRQLTGYLNRLLQLGFLDVAADPADPRPRYSVTEKGLQFLKDYGKLNRLLRRE
jgi:predicted transcriptional regulator